MIAERVFLINKRDLGGYEGERCIRWYLYDDCYNEKPLAERVDRFHGGTCYNSCRSLEEVAVQIANQYDGVETIVYRFLPRVTVGSEKMMPTKEERMQFNQTLQDLLVDKLDGLDSSK